MRNLEVKVTGLTVVDAEPGPTGWRTLAYFDCITSGLRLRGCSLVLSPQGKLFPNPPGIRGPAGARRAVHIIDPNLGEAMITAALRIYEAMGGSWRKVPNSAATPGEVTTALLQAGAPVATRNGFVAAAEEEL